MTANSKRIAVLDAAVVEVDRALTEGWIKPSGEPATENLNRLRSTLVSARANAERGEAVDASLAGVVRWVSDWIPDIRDPLIAALGNVERSL